MAKKKTSLSQTLFGQIDPYGTATEEAVSPAPEGPQLTLPLEEIRPDASQPRQLLPLTLSEALAAGLLTPAEALQEWLKQAEESENTASQRSIRELRRLAGSIAQHGLINPITVRQARVDESLPAGVKYIIVTGERRYWSHILLTLEGRTIQEGTEIIEPGQIKAFVVQAGISVRAHQLIENLMREDINAVEKARGLWALRYELSGVNHSSPPNEILETSEVNHGSPSAPVLVPWSQIEAALDISKRYRIFVTGVLELGTEAQNLVAEHNLSERVIRPITQKLKSRPDLQVKALQQLIRWREAQEEDREAGQPLVASTEALVAELLHQAEAQEKPDSTPTRKPLPVARRSPGTEQFRSKVQGALRFLNKLEEPDLIDLTQNLATTTQYAEVVEDLRDLRERIDAILDAVTIYSNQSN
ncbi:MAG: ParB N-terminal domain-containing protein [Anaerolineales bacterium]|nr:ParB N-terminal domain-containing protein [Anaerolineales bacterium]